MSPNSYAAFTASGFENNSIFELSHPRNRDDCLQPYYMLREKFKGCGIDLNTLDIVNPESLLFELQLDVQSKRISKFQYLLLMETAQIHPANGDPSHWIPYRKVFTWDDHLVDGDRFIKINFPNAIRCERSASYAERSRFCCMISSNRAAAIEDERTLYGERVDAIRWFEANSPNDFDLFGIDWDIPAARVGIAGKLHRHFWAKLKNVMPLNPFPSYRGPVLRKSDILSKTRFSICFENVRELNGYITEKIFDSFFAGCVPVYWGAENISDHIPRDCFIDRRNFRDTGEVHKFLTEMSAQEFGLYQDRILGFLRSEAAHQFSAEYFVETIVNTIMQDIGTQT